jgi:hypothetical protein
MALFWLVYHTDEDLNISIQEASFLISARLKAALAGLSLDRSERRKGRAAQAPPPHLVQLSISRRVGLSSGAPQTP